MSAISVVKTNGVSKDRSILRSKSVSLEEVLMVLSAYGEPRVAHDGGGWNCCVDMYVSSAGVSFKIRSEFSLKTPLMAAYQCAERLDKALSDVGA